MRSIMSRMRKEKTAEARDLSREAHKAAVASLKAARALENTQRHAGAKESVYEGDYLHNELFSEGMRDHAESLGDKAEDKIGGFFDRVEKAVDDRSDSKADEADRHLESMHHAVGQARKEAEAEIKRAKAEQAKPAAKESDQSAKDGEAKQTKSDDHTAATKTSEDSAKTDESSRSDSDDHEVATKKSDDSAKADEKKQTDSSEHAQPAKDDGDTKAADGSNPSGEDVSLASTEARDAPSPILGLCGLVALVTGMTLLVSLRSRREIREPLMLG